MKNFILLFLLFIGSGITLKAQKNLLANYPLLTDGNDVTGLNEAMNLTNTPFENGGIYCNGIYINSEMENAFEAVTPPVKNFNFNSFTVSMDFFVTSYEKMPVIVCGMSCRWLGFYLNPDSTIGLFYNNEYHLPCNKTYTINQWNNAQISYDGTTANAFINDTLACSIDISLEYALCGDSDTNIGVTNYSNGEVLNGYIKNLKVFSNPPTD